MLLRWILVPGRGGVVTMVAFPTVIQYVDENIFKLLMKR